MKTEKDKIKEHDDKHPGKPRKVLMTPELMDEFATRTADGRLVEWSWGEPDDDGFYTPTVTVVNDDQLLLTPGGLGATKDTEDDE
jgi:hypothetical protein